MDATTERLVDFADQAEFAKLPAETVHACKRRMIDTFACAIMAYDTRSYDHIARLFPHNPKAADKYRGEDKKAFVEATAFRNGTLQGAYFIIAARAVGLECGPMSGFATDKVDAEFFAGTSFKTNFLCNLGYGDASKVMPRLPRFEFDEVCKLL